MVGNVKINSWIYNSWSWPNIYIYYVMAYYILMAIHKRVGKLMYSGPFIRPKTFSRILFNIKIHYNWTKCRIKLYFPMQSRMMCLPILSQSTFSWMNTYIFLHSYMFDVYIHLCSGFLRKLPKTVSREIALHNDTFSCLFFYKTFFFGSKYVA